MSETPDSAFLTWAALVAHWTEFARASVALPTQGPQARWRKAVPDIIELQAITHALGEVDRLSRKGERAVALDRADLQIRACATRLHQAWHDEPLHPGLVELIQDARLALAGAAEAGSEWTVQDDQLIAEHPAELADQLIAAGFAGTLMLPAPGVPLRHGSPAAFAGLPGGEELPEQFARAIERHLGPASVGPPTRIPGARQVYRQFDFGSGRVVRDLVIPMRSGLPGGQPLLVLAIDRGAVLPVALAPRGRIELPDVPLVFAESLDG
ncbi:MAG: hypothetical protein AMXMBFR58_00490 [Phycisphaerae bacterium]|nr:hypothetical protein [Phycisphaerales bacterium]